MGLITNYNLRSMLVRKGTAAMTAMGIAMVVAVFVMTLAIAQGFRATLVSSGSPGNAIVLRKSATSETVSSVLKQEVPLVAIREIGGSSALFLLMLTVMVSDTARASAPRISTAALMFGQTGLTITALSPLPSSAWTVSMMALIPDTAMTTRLSSRRSAG